MVSSTNSPIISLEIVLSTLKDHQTTLRSFNIKSLALFGSVARNQATADSDLDFLVEFEEVTFDNYMDLKFFLENLFHKKVDLVIKTDLKPQIKEVVSREAIHVA
ncbi:MAG: nucleotidyltransferase family protein [Jaaginema sp. PMC 1079.18]|nr:nucleotidyltransferase family protein [Jaaginema sp. PMC 1080.18]MEC4850035.1 nucleotidyltransferase family protein [Jaaginema sp. PMC 1079.18]MEC4869026.1 nucleotidyltransferase family protein [Jaaginema sp. PMC 1078.18]